MHKHFICLLLEFFIYVGCTQIQSNVKTVQSSLPACNSDFEDASHLGLGRILLKKTKRIEYRNAVTFCQQRNSLPVEIESEEQMTYVRNKLKDLGEDTDGKTVVWCGGASDHNSEGTWKWSQSGKKVEDFVWGKNEPVSHDGHNFLGFSGFREFSGAAIDSARKCYPLCQQKM